MFRIDIHIKVAIGYIVFIFVLAYSGWLIYANNRTLQTVGQARAQMMERRNAADSMVYCLLEANNAERSVCMGDVDEWQHFENTMVQTRQTAHRLKQLIGNKRQKERIDSLLDLLTLKQENMERILVDMASHDHDAFFIKKVNDLHNGHDSVVIHPQTTEVKAGEKTVYEVVKSKRGFFARLADAFKRPHEDTVNVRREQAHTAIDTINHRIDIADTVADVLASIKEEENRAKQAQQRNIATRGDKLEAVSVALAQRTQLLMEDIQADEQNSLRTALSQDMEVRRATLAKMALLAAIAVTVAIILLLQVYHDIRKEHIYRRNLERAKAETERVMNQRERLLLTITHDIKAPAASIAGFIELLEEQNLSEKAKNYLDNIRSSAQHLHHLVSALLDYHQLENGLAKPHNVSFMPTQLVESSVGERQAQAKAKQLTLECHTEACGQTLCQGDAFRIKQILDNLISNALKYTVEGKVTVKAAVVNDWLTLQVTDTGMGMTDEECQRVFQAFTRLPNAQGVEGVGLGLSITREAVTLLGGDIRLWSKKGEGTTFKVKIPIAKDIHKEQAEKSAPNADITKRIAAAEAYKVLIVDDDPLQLQLLRELFAHIRPGRWNVITCQHTDEAIRTAQMWQPHILMADIEMPEMGGRELISRIDHQQMAVVAMTAHERSIEQELHQAGFDACLFKPFGIRPLTLLLKQLTGLSFHGDNAPTPPTATSQDRFAPLTAFAEGDKEAQQEILSNFKRSLTDYIQQLTIVLTNTNSLSEAERQTIIAHVAHKLLPIATMLNLQSTAIIQSLTPKQISLLDIQQTTTFAQTVQNELRQIKKELE